MHTGLSNCVTLSANQTIYGDEDSDSDDDVIDVLSADHCTGEHSYTMQMPSSMVQQVRKAAQKKAVEEFPGLSPELQSAYRLVNHFMSPACHKCSAPFINAFDTDQKEYRSYNKVIKSPMWFYKVHEKLTGNGYTSITEVVRDIRLILENCYRFFGPSHSFSKRAMKLETILEQKLALLPRELREKTSLEATTLDGTDSTTLKGRRARLMRPSTEMSTLMTIVKSENAARAREERVKQREERRFEKEVAYQVASDWDKDTFQEDLPKIVSLWDFPQVCQFLSLSQEILNLPEFSMCEAERMFVIPQQSVLLSSIMTCLLVSPHHRSKLSQKGPMPYRIWQDRLNSRLGLWYKTFHSRPEQPSKVFDVHGVEPQFFSVLGDNNPLEGKAFHELEVAQRVCLVKALCDYKLQQHKMMQDHFADQDADGMRERELGEDAEGNSYLYFPRLSERDVRIYRRGKIAPITYRFVPPKAPPPPKTPKRPPLVKKGKRKVQGKLAGPTASKVKVKEAIVTRTSSRRPSRLRQVIRPVRRHSCDKSVSPAKTSVEPIAEAEEDEEESIENFAEAEEEPAAENMSTEIPEPSLEMIVNSVAQLRDLIVSLQRKDEDTAVSTRSRGKQQDEEPNPTTRLQEKLVSRLQALLSELEPQEARFQQTEAVVRLKLYKEWHAFANRTEDQESSQHEDAWNAWTVRYRDEDNSIFEDSDEDSITDEELNEQASESAGNLLETTEVDESSTIRVLRKRKIVVPNGLLEIATTSDQRDFEAEVAKDEKEEEPPSRTEVKPRIPCYQLKELAAKPLESESEAGEPAPPVRILVQDMKVVAQSEQEHVVQQEAEVCLSEISEDNITDRAGCQITETMPHKANTPTNAAAVLLTSKKTFPRQRSMKINALLQARAISSTANHAAKTKNTPVVTAVRHVARHTSLAPKQTIARIVAASNPTQVKKTDEGKVLHSASRNAQADTLRNSGTKIKLVPAVDAKGENIFLRVEYTKAPTTAAPRVAAVRPLPPEEPQKKFCGTIPLKYGISSRAMASTAAETHLMKQKQENECPKPAILKSRSNPQQNAGRTFHLPWFKKNGIAVATTVREAQNGNDKGQKKFFRSKNVGVTVGQVPRCNVVAPNSAKFVVQSEKAEQLGTQQAVTEQENTSEPNAQHGTTQQVVLEPVSTVNEDSLSQGSIGNEGIEQEVTAQGVHEHSTMIQEDMMDENAAAQQSLIDRNLLVRQCPIDQATILQQQSIVEQNAILQQSLPQQVGSLSQQVLCSPCDAFLNQNTIMPLQDYTLSGFGENVILPQNNGSQVMYLLPEAQTNNMLVNTMASVQPQQTLLHQQPTVIDPSTFLNIPQPTEGSAEVPQQNPTEHQMDVNTYTIPTQPIAAKEHILQQAVESCLMGPGAEMGQEPAVNIVQQVPESVPQQQTPMFLLTNDGQLIQIVHSS